jgi:hypothetical protein
MILGEKFSLFGKEEAGEIMRTMCQFKKGLLNNLRVA